MQMTTKQLEKVLETIKELEKNYDFNDYVENYIDKDELKECEDVQDIVDLLEKANEDRKITDTEVIYYSNAIEYLKQNDPSLREALEIAKEYGYWDNLDRLNSEILASMLASRNNLDDWQTFLKLLQEKLDALFDNDDD